MFNRTEGMHQDPMGRSDVAGTLPTERTPREGAGPAPRTGKAEDMIALLADRMRRDEGRR